MQQNVFFPLFRGSVRMRDATQNFGCMQEKGLCVGDTGKNPKSFRAIRPAISGFPANPISRPFRQPFGQAFGQAFWAARGKASKASLLPDYPFRASQPDPGLVILISASDFSRLLPALVTVYMHRPQLDLSHPRSGNSAMWRYR